MRLLIFPLFITFLFISCANNSGSSTSINDNDSINGMTAAEWKKNYVDSMTRKLTKEAIFDTVGLSTAPVKVIKASLFKEEYSNYKSIRLAFKNASDKKIDAIRFAWYGENSFGEPADMGNPVLEGYGGGFMDKTLGPGKSMTLIWNILSRDGKKVILAWPTEVAFADGTKWKL